MPIFMESVRRLWIPGLANVQAKSDLDVSAWLKTASFYVLDASSQGRFVIQFASLDEVSPLFAVTANRVFSDCFESIISAREVELFPRSIAWLLVKLYYAAFFAAHGHMRVCGVSCANLDAVDAARIYDVAQIYGVLGNVNRIASGQYLLTLDPNTSTVSFSVISAKGSHEALWRSYKEFIEAMIANAPMNIPVKQQRDIVTLQLDRLLSILCLSGSNGGNWLSRFRNSVQYRHSHGVWYPYSLDKSLPPKIVGRTLAAFVEDPDETSLVSDIYRPEKEVDTFYRCTMFLSAIARATTVDLAERSTNSKGIARRGAISFLRQCQFDEMPRPTAAKREDASPSVNTTTGSG